MIHDDDAEYEEMRLRGDAPDAVFLVAERSHDTMTAIRIVRSVFNLSLAQAKEVMIRVHGGAKTLSEHQESLLPALRTVLRDEEAPD